jgi:hypothetical protein
VTGKISGNYIWNYQKGGIVANGQGTQVNIFDNIVEGEGHVNYIAQNGIQVGFGATASVMRNTVRDNSYIGYPGDGSASGGILIVGGPAYGGAFTVNSRANDNILVNNDVGVYLSNLNPTFQRPWTPRTTRSNNTITNDLCFNTSYQAGIRCRQQRQTAET